jgi:hypothetical protein
MLDQIIKSEDSELCISVLAIVSTVYRPITIDELVTLVELPDGVDSEHEEAVIEVVGYCRSFLTLRERTIYFVHQSAKEFLLQEKTSQELFPAGVKEVHYKIFWRSLQMMSQILRPDIYSLHIVGISIDQVQPPDPDPLATIRYSCLYWVNHLLEYNVKKESSNDLKDSGLVHSFLRENFLYWLEALSLMKSVSDGITMIRKLESLQVRFSAKSYKVDREPY